MPRLMHYGFGMPVFRMLLCGSLIVFFMPTWFLVLFLTLAYIIIETLLDKWTMHRVDRRISNWGKANGFSHIERKPTGGFPSWGWTINTSAEILRYEARDVNGVTRSILASYRSSWFGLWLYTLAEVESTNAIHEFHACSDTCDPLTG